MMAAILILSVFSQLMLTKTMAVGDVTTIEKRIMDLNRSNTLIAYYLHQIDNAEIDNEAIVYDCIRNKLHDIQNLITKLYEDPANEKFVERLSSIQRELRRLENIGCQTEQHLGRNSFSNFTNSLKKHENSTEKLAKLKLEKAFNEFLEAIKYQNYQFAVIKFVSIKNETIARDFVKSIYEKLDNIDCLLKFTDYLNDMSKKLFVYRSLFDAVNYKITSLIEICKLFKIRMKLYYNISDKVPNELQTVANNMLKELDKRIEIWLAVFTVSDNQDLIVKIKYHSKLYGPVNYVHNVTYTALRRQEIRGLTSVLSCYPLQCNLNKA